METYVQSTYASRAEAEAAAQDLIGSGIPAHCVQVSNNVEPMAEEEAVGASLGFGVPVEATNALIQEHEDETSAETADKVYIVSVNTEGDEQQLEIARRFFGYAA